MTTSDGLSSERPVLRSFSLNSPEAYETMCAPEARPWIPNGSLPREPKRWEPAVIVELGRGRKGR